MIKRTFTVFNLLKMMLAAKDAMSYRPPPATVLFAGTFPVLCTEAVIKLQILLVLLARGWLSLTRYAVVER